MASKRNDRKAPRKEKGLGRGLKLLIIVTVIAVIVIAGVQAFQPTRPAAPTSATTSPKPGYVGVGDTAPDFSLRIVTEEGLTPQSLSLSSFRGKVVLVEFLVSWCQACRQMEPAVGDLYKIYGPEEVEFLSVAGTYGGATAESTSQFIKEFRSPWAYLLDTTSGVFEMYGIQATPTFFIISREGKVLARIEGGSYEQLAVAITNALIAKTA
jgi:thiol-disulfide isomerase/thioredoxin